MKSPASAQLFRERWCGRYHELYEFVISDGWAGGGYYQGRNLDRNEAESISKWTIDIGFDAVTPMAREMMMSAAIELGPGNGTYVTRYGGKP